MNLMQMKLLRLIKWFHKFCVDNKLQYYMLGGTMLGAVRHSGFIPWDDDADFGMPRKDYEKFLSLTINSHHLGDNILVESFYNKNDDFPYYFAKIYDTSTTLIEESKERIVRGIYIDVFPLDGLGKNKPNSFKIKRNFLKINFYNAKRFKTSKKRSAIKNVSTVIAKIIPPYSKKHWKISSELNKMVSKFKYGDSDFIANYFGAWQFKEIVARNIMGKPRLYKFEDCHLYGPELSSRYLEQLYGDYMQLPPIEKRGNHHSFAYVNLEESYLEYKCVEKKKIDN